MKNLIFFVLWLKSLFVYWRQIRPMRVYQDALTINLEQWGGGAPHTIMFFPYHEDMMGWLWQMLRQSRFVIRKWGHPDEEDGGELLAFAKQEERVRKGQTHPFDPPAKPEQIFQGRRGIRPNPTNAICRWEGNEGALLVDVAYEDGRRLTWIVMPNLTDMPRKLKRLFVLQQIMVIGYRPFNKADENHRTVLAAWKDFWHGSDASRGSPGEEPLPPVIQESWLSMLTTSATNEIPAEPDTSGDRTILEPNPGPIPQVSPPDNGRESRPIRLRDLEHPFGEEEARRAQAFHAIGTGRTGATQRLVSPVEEPPPRKTSFWCGGE